MGVAGRGLALKGAPPWANLTRRQQTVSAACLLVGYVGAGALAKQFDLPNGASAWYPPAAVMLAYLLVAGPRFVPVAIAARVVSDLINFPELVEADGLVTVVVGAAVVAAVYGWGAWVLRRTRLDYARLRQFGWFASVGVVVCPLLAASGFAVVQILFGHGQVDRAMDQIGTFWVGDAVAVSSIVPFVALGLYARLAGTPYLRVPSTLIERLEALIQALAIVLVPIGIFAARSGNGIAPYLFLAMIPVVWVALRQDLLTASFGVLVANTTVAIEARLRLGASEDFVQVQTVMLAAAIAALYAGAVRRTENQRLAESVESELRYRTLVDNSPSVIARFDLDGELAFRSGPPKAAALDADLDRALRESWASFRVAADTGAPVDCEWTLGEGDATRWLSTRATAEHTADGVITSVLTVTSDRTALQRAALELAATSRRDALTGMCSRSAIGEKLEPATDQRPASVVAFLLDSADTMTAGLSRAVADDVVVALAERIGSFVGHGETVGRTAPAGFAVVAAEPRRAKALAEQVVESMSAPLMAGGQERYLSLSAGICTPTSSVSVPQLEQAELAGLLAQMAGGGRVAEFTDSLEQAASETRANIQALRRAVEDQEFVVHYQPIVDLRDGHLVGLEALLRWQQPEGLVVAQDFVGLAEQFGFVDSLGAEVERLMLSELVPLWKGIGDANLALNLNVSAAQLLSAAFLTRIISALDSMASSGLELHLELTETSMMVDPERACAALEQLRSRGARVVLDDFGTGYSSISWLHKLPVDAIKLDCSFVTGVAEDPASARIVRTIMTLATELGLAVTAEGIETQAQRETLINLGCTQGQGYLFGRPMPASDLAAYIAQSDFRSGR